MPIVKVRQVREGAQLPEYKTPGAAAADLYACVDEPRQIYAGDLAIIPTGLAFEIPPGWEGQIRPRSGLALKRVTVINSPGTIDADYRGEVMVLLVNHSNRTIEIRDGDRVAQLVISPVTRAAFEPVDELAETDRGEGGFGSTGK